MAQDDRILLISATDDPPLTLSLHRTDGTRVVPRVVGPDDWVAAVREHQWDRVLCPPALMCEHAFERGQREVLELIAAGAPLSQQLEQIVLLIEAQAPGMTCSILLLDRDHQTLHTGAAPHLPQSFVRAIEGAKIGPTAGSCGAAAHRNERVIIEDIATHEYWADYRHLALPYGLRACWSSPIVSVSGAVLGTFAMYYQEPRGPGPQEIHWVERATHIAAIAIERELAESKERLHSLVHDLIEDVIFYVAVEPDEQYRFVSVNPAFTKVTGLREQDVVGRSLAEVLPDESRSEQLGHFAIAVTERRTVSWYQVVRFPSGFRHGRVTLTPICSAYGGCTHLIGTIHDITELQHAHEQIVTQAALLHHAQRLESLGVLASGIAHDFNNILTAISASAGLVSETFDPKNAREALLQIERASERGSELVGKLLAFSRRQDPKRERIDLAAVVREAASLLRASLAATVSIRPSFGAEVPRIFADTTQMHQVVINLITNAAHAMAASGGVIEVIVDRVVVESDVGPRPGLRPGSYARLRVIDTGTGMNEATLQRIFDPFFTTKPPGQGTGLGLAVVLGIVESHGGVIVVHSTPGSGTEVEVYFPAAH